MAYEREIEPGVVERDGAPVHVYPLGRMPDMGHSWTYRNDELFAGFVEAFGSRDADCFLCQSACCVRRHFYFADGGHLVVHGAYEA